MKFSFSPFVYCFKAVDIKAGKLQNIRLITERATQTPKTKYGIESGILVKTT